LIKIYNCSAFEQTPVFSRQPIVTRQGGSVLDRHCDRERSEDGKQSTMSTQTQEDTAFRVMRLLQANPDLTQRELAQQLGISVGGLNYCLNALVKKGWVKMKISPHSKNKYGFIYVLTPSGIAEKASITHRFLLRKANEYTALKAEIEALIAEMGIDQLERQRKKTQ
jgi:EPS-associated MarR family transcriptional regulator